MLHPVALKTSVWAYQNRKVLSKFLEQVSVGNSNTLWVSKNIPKQFNVLVKLAWQGLRLTEKRAHTGATS